MTVPKSLSLRLPQDRAGNMPDGPWGGPPRERACMPCGAGLANDACDKALRAASLAHRQSPQHVVLHSSWDGAPPTRCARRLLTPPNNLGVDNHGLLGAGTPSGGLGRSPTWAIWCEGVYLGLQGDRMRWYISVD